MTHSRTVTYSFLSILTTDVGVVEKGCQSESYSKWSHGS